MSVLRYLRVLGYSVTIAVHVTNILVMGANSSPDPRIAMFKENRPRYLTGWNVTLQIVHAVLGLVCEYILFKSPTDHKLPRYLKASRDKLFSNVVFPGSCLVATVFWTLFAYDRELVFPRFLDQIVPPSANHVIHTFIVPVVLYEILVQPRCVPRSHFWNLMHLLLHCSVYSAVLFYTYYEKGQWLYPILGRLSPPAFAFFGVFAVSMALSFYFLQWKLVSYVWGDLRAKKVR